MRKMIAILTLTVLAVSPLVYAAVRVAPGEKPEAAVEVGNKICPVGGEPVSGSDFVVYEGKKYGLCCAGCAAIFLNDPVKYLAALNEKEAAR